MARHLLVLRNFEIAIVCDDSGSMNTIIDQTNRKTRWDRLREIVKIILEVAVIFDEHGVDIFFLNRPAVRGVKRLNQIEDLFTEPPRGYTPLVPVLNDVFQLRAAHPGYDKKLLVFMATDGAPTDGDGNENIDELEDLMRNKRNLQTTFVKVLLCTDDRVSVAYLDGWDRTMEYFDITRDFEEERALILLNGIVPEFTFGDYVVKALVGAIIAEIDCLDESPQ